MSGYRILFCSALVLFLVGAFAARAEDPTRSRVGRIAEAVGDVAVRAGPGVAGDASPTGKWAGWGRNNPIAAGMSVRTPIEGRALLRIGAEVVALAADTEVEIVQLDAGRIRLALRRGRIGVHLSTLDPAREAGIELAQGSARMASPGDYDVTAGDGKAAARLAVLAGTAQFAGNGLTAAIGAGGAVLLSGSERVRLLPGSTEADAFVTSWRPIDVDPLNVPALRDVSAAMTGYEALDEYGRWETAAGYGAVWFPNEVPDGWAPYRHGHWRWIGPWGWTWIDDMPWGFAPSHYGRWARIGAWDAGPGRWGWVPGASQTVPPYMPAAVAFLGTAGVGLSYPDAFSPAVAWFPLAPGEVYWPDFTDDIEAIRRLNAGAVADPAALGPAMRNHPPRDILTGEYRNRRFATVVPRSVFLGGKPVAEALIELPARRLEYAPLLAGSPQIDPPTPRPAAIAAPAAKSSPVIPKAVKAGEALARILKARMPKKREIKPVAAKRQEVKIRRAKKRDPKARNVRAAQSAVRPRAARNARNAPSRTARLPGSRSSAPRSEKARLEAVRSRAATLRRAGESGG